VELTGLQMVELFTARFRQEDGFRDLKQRLGWEESPLPTCRRNYYNLFDWDGFRIPITEGYRCLLS
jgi:hypothetical protein